MQFTGTVSYAVRVSLKIACVKQLVIGVHLNGMTAMKNYSCIYNISNVLVKQSMMTITITYVNLIMLQCDK